MKNIMSYSQSPAYDVLDHILQPDLKHPNFDPAKKIPLYITVEQECLSALATIKTNKGTETDITKAITCVMQAIRILVFKYKVVNLSKTDARKQLEKVLKSLKIINPVIQKKKISVFIYNNFLCTDKHNKYPLTWDEFIQIKALLKKLEIMIQRLLKKTTVTGAHRPKSDDTQKNNINREFMQSLMQAYTYASGLKPTVGVISGTFINFANNIISIVNKYFPSLNDGHNLSFNTTETTKRLITLSKVNNS